MNTVVKIIECQQMGQSNTQYIHSKAKQAWKHANMFWVQLIWVFIGTSNDEVLVIKLGCFGYYYYYRTPTSSIVATFWWTPPVFLCCGQLSDTETGWMKPRSQWTVISYQLFCCLKYCNFSISQCRIHTTLVIPSRFIIQQSAFKICLTNLTIFHFK